MRGRVAAVVGSIILAACSSGGGDATPTTTPGSPATTVSETTSPAATAAPSTTPATTSPATAPGLEGVELPGLLDTSDERLADDPEVRTGVLDNGLRYYVRQNDNPGAKADMRLAIRAGSVDESGEPTGVAHFVEHMLFNGTEKFPENELISVLRSFGAAFGADVNAYTSFEETVYMLTVPNDDQTVVLGLEVLEQWLSHATFDPDQVVAERGVVLDEWRIRTQRVQGRLLEIAASMYLTGSAFEGRLPIGVESSIADMTAETLVDFYDTWYRPDNAAIVVVGDIDVDDVVADIERLFGPATARTPEMPARPDTEFALETEPDVAFHVDPDQQTVDVEVTLPLPAYRTGGTAELRAQLIDSMIFDTLVRRLQIDVTSGVAPFDDISRGTNSLVDGLDAPALYAFTDAARAADTLDALLDEYVRAARDGFTEAEADTARAAVLSGYRSLYEGRGSHQDAAYADSYANSFLADAAFPSIETEYEAAVEVLDGITAEAMHHRFVARWEHTAPHVIMSVPAGVEADMPTRDDVLAAIAADRSPEPRAQLDDLPTDLMERPDPVAPTDVEYLLDQRNDFFDPKIVTYPNGVRVIFTSNKIVAGQVYLNAAGSGGTSLVDDADVVDALYAPDIVTTSGVGDLDQAQLGQMLAGDDIELTAGLSPYRESFQGRTATADMERFLQLIHLYMTAPRVDDTALARLVAKVGPIVRDPSTDRGLAVADAGADARYQNELRYTVLPEPDEFDTLDAAGVKRVWTERFGNAADWVFVFSGDLDPDTLLELTDAYLGTLPAGEPEEPVDVSVDPPSEPVIVEVTAGTGNTAIAEIQFSTPVDEIDPALRVTADVTSAVLSARLEDVVRERLGDSYSPSVRSWATVDPDPIVNTGVRVTGAPDRIRSLVDLVVAEFDDIATNGPTEAEFRNAFAEIEERYQFVSNDEFATELLNSQLDATVEIEDYLFAYGALYSVGAESVQRYVADYVTTDAFVAAVVTPVG